MIKIIRSDEDKDESGPYPFASRKTLDDDITRMHPEFRAKLPDFASLLRVRNALTHAINDYFRRENFIQVHFRYYCCNLDVRSIFLHDLDSNTNFNFK